MQTFDIKSGVVYVMSLYELKIENQYREQEVASLIALADRLSQDSAHDAMLVLGAVTLLTDQGAEMHSKLGNYHYDRKNWIGAVFHFKKSVLSNPLDYVPMFYLASAYKMMGHCNEAIDMYKKSLALHTYPEALVNLASVYSDINQTELELETLEYLTSNFPGFALGHYNLGVFWYGKKRIASAIDSYRKALEVDPEYGEAKVALSLALLMDKQYIEGFKLHDYRWGVSPNCPVRDFHRPYWYGQEVPKDSSVLVTLEQGFGDTLQMLRYVPLLEQKFKTVSIEVQPQMRRLVALSFPKSNVVVHGESLPDTDYYCPVMSLPRAFETTYETIPTHYKYIEIPCSSSFNIKFGDERRYKIGICWKGGMLNPAMAHRSISLESIKQLFEHGEYTWVSLVKELSGDERLELKACSGVTDLTSELTDFYDTYRLILGLDVVISVDTAVAHLSAAMGKPTIIILNEGFDWRWHVDDDFSPWYPSVLLLRAYLLESSEFLVSTILMHLKRIRG